MMKLRGNPMSTCTRIVLTTLAETGTPFEMKVVDFSKGEHKQPEHMAHQPFGRIPVLEDDGFEMYESRAICRYVNDKAGDPLEPTDPRARARVEQWISVEASEFSPHAMKFVYEHTFKRPQAPGVIEAAGKGLETTLGVMEKQLASTPFLAGEAFTLADVVFMPYVDYAMATPAKELFTKFPHVIAWWNKVSERPSWRKAAGKG